MAGLKSKQIFLAACLMASLFIGSASACACTHHEPKSEKVETETSSCHSHAKTTESEQAETNTEFFASGDGCICAANAQRAAAKSENLKLKKLVAAITPKDLPTNATREKLIVTVATFVAKASYLSDSFYNLAPTRGPPRA